MSTDKVLLPRRGAGRRLVLFTAGAKGNPMHSRNDDELRAQVQAQARRLGIKPMAKRATAVHASPRIAPSASRPQALGKLLAAAFEGRPAMVGMPLHLVLKGVQ